MHIVQKQHRELTILEQYTQHHLNYEVSKSAMPIEKN